MDTRLEAIYSLIENGVGVIDVGTDHGFIPAALAQSGYSGNIIASDINVMPLESAMATARAAGVSDRITFLLSDGLEKCQPSAIDTIIIAGMGGDTVCGILDRAEWCLDGKYKLILQPMTKPEVVRCWLINNGFEIKSEALAEADKKLYAVICAVYGGKTELRDAELYTGGFLTLCKDPLFKSHIDNYINKFEKILSGINASGKCEAVRQKIYMQILSELKEMEWRLNDTKF